MGKQLTAEYKKLSAPYCFLYRKRPPEFIVKTSTGITVKDLNKIARTVIQNHKDQLFAKWKLHPANRNWTGNVRAKKSALMRLEPLPNPVILEPACTASLLKSI